MGVFLSFCVKLFQIGKLNSSLGVLKSSYTLEITLQPHYRLLGERLLNTKIGVDLLGQLGPTQCRFLKVEQT